MRARCSWMRSQTFRCSTGETLAGHRDGRIRASRFIKNTSCQRANHLRHKCESGEEIAAGRFRQDLLFRLNTIEIELPPLRDRREDIMPLANSFLRQHAARIVNRLAGFDERARERLLLHRFPGNIRELDHVIERAVLMTQGPQISADDLGLTSGGAERERRGNESRGSGSFPDQESAGPQ